MKEAGYGIGYEYAHNLENKKSSQEHFPEELRGRKYRKLSLLIKKLNPSK